MANPQPDQFTKLSNELYEAIMKTDFSKRQRNILDLVIRLSYGCRKKFAILRPSDFEVVGILRGHVKKELEYLQTANVMTVDGEIYTLNKDYDTWRVGIYKSFNHDKFTKILLRNIQQNVTETVTNVTEMVTDEVTKMVTNVTETVTSQSVDLEGELPKQEQGCYQNSNNIVTETVTGTSLQPNQDKGSESPKDNKEIFKDSSTRSLKDSAAAATDFSFGQIYKIYEEHFAVDGKVSPFEAEDLSDQFETYGGEWLLEAMREAVRAKVRTLAYINGVLNGFKTRGSCKKEKDSTPPAQPNSQESMFDEDDPIMRMMREEDRIRRGTTATAAAV